MGKIISIIGVSMIILTGIGVVIPVNDLGFSIITLNDLCKSNAGQFIKSFEKAISSDIISEKCSLINYSTYGIFGLGIVGIILIIVGISKFKTKNQITCPYCNFMSMDELDLEKHKADNHLDKSPYKCGHCDFIGITEEILWNHYVEKHPKEKKW
jgi:DNA-directed RNA polymerase subunit RPC12/RpoP